MDMPQKHSRSLLGRSLYSGSARVVKLSHEERAGMESDPDVLLSPLDFRECVLLRLWKSYKQIYSVSERLSLFGSSQSRIALVIEMCETRIPGREGRRLHDIGDSRNEALRVLKLLVCSGSVQYTTSYESCSNPGHPGQNSTQNSTKPGKITCLRRPGSMITLTCLAADCCWDNSTVPYEKLVHGSNVWKDDWQRQIVLLPFLSRMTHSEFSGAKDNDGQLSLLPSKKCIFLYEWQVLEFNLRGHHVNDDLLHKF
ncbi:hypothetical protein Tco_0891073 [Tanacetum coccineum]|uniref:Uncharacterized protein n=1 Tax=Tanacetum coccineum TaxID=301880 RepID=A0ABQ5C586_9ASTR